MDVYTLDKQFRKEYVIDGFSSVIWTERYLGDSNTELLVPLVPSMISKITPGVFLSIDASKEVMIVDTILTDEKAGTLKATGNSLLNWLVNRFIRTTNDHSVKSWAVTSKTPGQLMSYIVQQMCIDGPYLDGTIDTGIPDPESLKIPNLMVEHTDTSGPTLDYAVPFGPVYDALKDLSNTYSLGMQLILNSATPTSYLLQFRNYKGTDRSSSQTAVPLIRFSSDMDTLTDVKEVASIDPFRSIVYAFAPNAEPPLTGVPGISSRSDAPYTGFDLRAQMIFCDDITTELVDSSGSTFHDLLTSRAHDALMVADYARAVDGGISPLNQYQYGRDYFMGDIIEVQGNSGTVKRAQVTEYIRAQDQAGERAYSGLTPV